MKHEYYFLCTCGFRGIATSYEKDNPYSSREIFRPGDFVGESVTFNVSGSISEALPLMKLQCPECSRVITSEQHISDQRRTSA